MFTLLSPPSTSQQLTCRSNFSHKSLSFYDQISHSHSRKLWTNMESVNESQCYSQYYTIFAKLCTMIHKTSTPNQMASTCVKKWKSVLFSVLLGISTESVSGAERQRYGLAPSSARCQRTPGVLQQRSSGRESCLLKWSCTVNTVITAAQSHPNESL